MIRKVCVPKIYGKFHCIDVDCSDSCCAGWQVDVDEESFAYYQSVEGEFGDYMRSVMVAVPGEEGQFRLKKDGRCPFLNDAGLCDLYTNLGEDRLCKTCTNFPRFMEDYGERREVGIAFSCPEAARLMLEQTEPMQFVVEDAVAPQQGSMALDVMQRTKGMGIEDMVLHEEDGDVRIHTEAFDEAYANCLFAFRETAYQIVQNRSLPIAKRVMLFFDFAKQIQDAFDHEDEQALLDISSYFSENNHAFQWWEKLKCKFLALSAKKDAYILYEQPVAFGELAYRFIPEYIAVIYQELKHCKPQWGPMLSEAEEVLHKGMSVQQYQKLCKEFDDYIATREYEYEHLMSYFIFKYFMKAYFDDDVYGKAQLAVMGYLVLHELALCQWVKQEKVFTKEDQIELFHLYSREMEHSEENYEEFTDMLKMEHMCNYEHLMGILLELCHE